MDWLGGLRLGLAGLGRHGTASCGGARSGMAWQARRRIVRRGRAGIGEEWRGRQGKAGDARCGRARRFMERRGEAWSGGAWQARHGLKRRGGTGLGRIGEARCVTASQHGRHEMVDRYDVTGDCDLDVTADGWYVLARDYDTLAALLREEQAAAMRWFERTSEYAALLREARDIIQGLTGDDYAENAWCFGPARAWLERTAEGKTGV